jgi:pilus assembly protein FimV
MEGAGKDNLWKSVAEWGRKISPDNALYQGSAVPTAPAPAPASSVAATVATALGGMAAATAGASLAADNKVSEPTPVPRDDYPADDFSDLDLGEMDFDDIDLDKLLQDSDEMADFGEPPVEDKSAVSSEIAPELPTLPELDVAETKPAPLAAAADDEPFDFNLDELDDLDDDLDLDFTLDTDDKAPQPAQESIAVKPREPEPDNMYEAESSDHLLDFDLDELDDLDDLVGNDDAIPATPANHVAATAAAVAVPVVAAAAANSTNLNLHLDNQTGINRILPKDTFYAPISDEDKDWLGDIDDALSFLDFPDEEIDLHEAHISTKLDLARAYLDMGDIEGARSTLEEVMVEGNDDQRREAEVLLHQTG